MRNNYSISELISTSIALVLTRIYYPQARLIRRPFFIRGKYNLELSEGLTIGHNCRFDLPKTKKKTLFIGSNCEFGDNVHIVALDKVQIGNNVLIASKVFISDTNHGNYSGENQTDPNITPNKRELVTKSIKIGENVWIGENVCILPGVNIGDGCIIGANSIVNKDVPNFVIAGGVPFHIIKKYDFELNVWKRVNEINNTI